MQVKSESRKCEGIQCREKVQGNMLSAGCGATFDIVIPKSCLSCSGITRGDGPPRGDTIQGWHPNESLNFLRLNLREHWTNDRAETVGVVTILKKRSPLLRTMTKKGRHFLRKKYRVTSSFTAPGDTTGVVLGWQSPSSEWPPLISL